MHAAFHFLHSRQMVHLIQGVIDDADIIFTGLGKEWK
jgi:hypothetical protein